MKSDSVGLGGAKGWGLLMLASLVMVATLPARSVGLGLIKFPMIEELGISSVDFDFLNLWATVIGALFVLVAGWALDRIGLRWVTTVIVGIFAGVVFWMANLEGPGVLLGVLILIKGLGQSGMSLASITIVGKWFQNRLSVAMGVFAVVVALLFVAAILGIGDQANSGGLGWRKVWTILAFSVGGLAVLILIFLRDPPGHSHDIHGVDAPTGMTFAEALGSPVLWLLTLGTAIYYFSFTAITLNGASIVASLGFPPDMNAQDRNVQLQAILMGTGLLGNLGTGWLAQKVPILRVYGAALLLFAVCLFGYPFVGGSERMLYLVIAGMGLGGGTVAVVFFTGFAEIFGRRSLGKIQGVAQGASVAASGTGPWVTTLIFDETKSYSGAFTPLAVMLSIVGVWTLAVRKPTGGMGR